MTNCVVKNQPWAVSVSIEYEKKKRRKKKRLFPFLHERRGFVQRKFPLNIGYHPRRYLLFVNEKGMHVSYASRRFLKNTPPSVEAKTIKIKSRAGRSGTDSKSTIGGTQHAHLTPYYTIFSHVPKTTIFIRYLAT